MIDKRLQILRKSRNYTVAQFCSEIGMNVNTYVKYERGERDVSTETLCKLADFYGVSTDYLLGRNEDEPEAIEKLECEFNMSALEKKILQNYLTLPNNMRGDFMEFLQKSVAEIENEKPSD